MAAIWTLIGLLGASLGVLTAALYGSLTRIDAARDHSDSQFAAIRELRSALRAS